MSYTFLQEQGEESSAESFSDIPRSVLSRLNLTAEKYFSNGSETESYQGSPSGTTCEPSTESHGEGSLTLFAVDSPAKTSALQDPGEELTDRKADYGRSKGVLLARFDRDTCSWKTPQLSLLEEGSESLRIWPQWAMWDQAGCWEQRTPYGILATRARITNVAASGSVERIPTPTVCGNYNRKGASKTSGDGFATHCRRYPTPTAHMAKECAAPSEFLRNSQTMGAILGGTPNPEFAEWLMGWPIGWTGLRPLETDKFQQWLRSHFEPYHGK